MSTLWRFTLMGDFEAEPVDPALAEAVDARWNADANDEEGGESTLPAGLSSPSEMFLTFVKGRSPSGSPLSKEGLGVVAVSRNYEITPVDHLDPKHTALLAYLAAHPGEKLLRGNLAETFWLDTDDPRGNLRQALTQLRKRLEPLPGLKGSVIVADNVVAGLNPAAITSDWGDLQKALHAATNAETEEERIRVSEAAVELYHGEFMDKRLEGHFPDGADEWLAETRKKFHEDMYAPFCCLAKHYEDVGEGAKAITCLSRAAASRPESDVCTRDLMRLLAASGRRLEALDCYTHFRKDCQKRGTKPSEDTRGLANQIKAQIDAAHGEDSDASAPEPPTPLPHAPLELFIGRGEELAQLSSLLCVSPTRLVTLLGMGGCGKTRLAVQAGEALRGEFPGGFHAVYMAGCPSPDLIVSSIRDALPLPRHGSDPPFDQVTKYLRSKPALLLLDNMEHLLGNPARGAQKPQANGAAAVRQLLEAVPSLRCLVTSRQVLGIGEKEVRLEPLPVPREKDTLDAVRANDSARLFEDRAQKVEKFQISYQNYRDVAAICRRLEGIPLALELTAPMTKFFTLRGILKELKDRLDAFKSVGADTPERHRTLRAAIESSYDTLSPDLQWTLTGLTVFRGGWSIDAVVDILQEPSAADFLVQLCNRSLVAVQGQERRFHMMEAIRDYACEQMSDDTAEQLNRRHAEYFTALAEETTAPHGDEDDSLPPAPLGGENENVRAALHWLLERARDTGLGVRLAGAMFPFWLQRNDFAEARRWLEDAVRCAGGVPDRFRARALCGLGAVLTYECATPEDAARAECLLSEAVSLSRNAKDTQGEAYALFYSALLACDFPDGYAKALSLQQESLSLFRTLKDQRGMADVLEDAGVVSLYMGEAGQARQYLEEALRLCRKLEDDWRTAHVLQSLGNLAWRVGSLPEAECALNEAQSLFPHTGDRFNEAFTLALSGSVAAERGAAERADALYDESRPIFEELNSARGMATVDHYRAISLHLNGNLLEARRLLWQSLRLCSEGDGYAEGRTATLRSLGVVAARLGEARLATLLFGHVQCLRETGGAGRWPPLSERTAYDKALAAARASLDGAFQTVWSEGREMPTEDAVGLALGEP